MSAKIPYAVKITNTDLRTFISKKHVCRCGDITYNESGMCETCKIEAKLIEDSEVSENGSR